MRVARRASTMAFVARRHTFLRSSRGRPVRRKITRIRSRPTRSRHGDGIPGRAARTRIKAPRPGGARVLEQRGCAACHVPTLRAGNRDVAPYSDLLLHDMGHALNDSVVQGSATGPDWRTTQLWGLSARAFSTMAEHAASRPPFSTPAAKRNAQDNASAPSPTKRAATCWHSR